MSSSTGGKEIGDGGVRIGFIGCGRMASAMVGGLVKAGFTTPDKIVGSDVYKPSAEAMATTYGVNAVEDNNAVVSQSHVVVLAVKPYDVPSVLSAVSDKVQPDQVFVSICAGVTLATLESALPEKTQVVRVMPNTPCLVGAVAAGVAANNHTTKDNAELVLHMFQALGVGMQVKESLLNAVTGLSGSGPAYGFLAIEALADGGVMAGLPRNVALKLAAQTMMGAAKMVLETEQHPGVLKDQVCSPGGTTIAGVRALEAGGLRSAFISAVVAATARADELGKN